MAADTSVQRKILQIAVCALCREQGFASTSRMAMETMTEMLQSYLSELARSAKTYCELSSRVRPTLGDVRMALIDMGADLDSIPVYAKRTHRLHVNNPLKSRVPPAPKALETGPKEPCPPYIPPHLPSFPDPHSYVKTPTTRQASEEYKAVRERYASQRKDIEQGLARFLAKTAEHKSGVCEGLDTDSSFLLIMNFPPHHSYLPALLNEERTEDGNSIEKNALKQDVKAAATGSSEIADNPFMRPAKRPRKSFKSS
ncbi:predicted protein [Nematostella vectensis]|uniref:Transcription initiation factor TFIID subunit 8 n=1 Tax=Nematostella vectensis TaxID=45351 RepID=A7RU65_NEMVE|nr:transcription initiation factor TFIID subunit 8 [Nematostella vectensis]EDO45029.1 predicted protein [Nematostella vectensis]|eukprot:XP_001637092.1 predicted protein [Nematostella vectensis]